MLVLEKGRLAFDGPADEGIRFLHYDDDDGDELTLDAEQEMDEALGADI